MPHPATRTCALRLLTCFSLCAAGWAHAQDDAPAAKPRMQGFIEAGTGGHQLTAPYPDQQAVFLRGEIQPSAELRWTGELNHIREFDDAGTLLALGVEKSLHPLWVLQAGVATSDVGITLPRLRLDLALGRKWLADANLVTTLGLTRIDSRDAHTTDVLQLSAAYYFDIPMGSAPYAASLEGGVQNNTSNPGAVNANYYYAAFTLSRPQQRTVSLRLGNGREAYLPLGEGTALVDFSSSSALLTWREWLWVGSGLQLRLEHYSNPSYTSRGLELSWFRDF